MQAQSQTQQVLSPTVLVFRKRLLPYSETFIVNQARHLPTFTPVFCGFARHKDGLALLRSDSEAAPPLCIEADCSRVPWLSAGLHKQFGWLNRRWLAELKKYQPRLLHAHFGADGMAAIPLAKTLNIPLVTTFHGFDITIDQPTNTYRKNRHRVFAASQKVIAVSEFVKSQLLAKGCPPEKIIQHYIGVDTSVFKPATSDYVAGRVLFVGRLIDKKGCEYLLRAMAEVCRQFPQAHLKIVGDGELMPSLRVLAAELKVAAEFTGRLKPADIITEIQQAALLCAPSITSENGDQEGLPMSITEALACATPVVSTYSAGIAEAVKDGHNGYLLAEKDVRGLSRAIQDILNNPLLRRQMQTCARQSAEEKFNLANQCRRLEQIYLQAIDSFSTR